MQSRLIKVSASLTSLLLLGCGAKTDVSTLPTFSYFLEETSTGLTENRLIVTGLESQSALYKITGTGFTTDIPLDKETPVLPRLTLKYTDVGDYKAQVEFFRSDGTPLFKDLLHWTYSLENPDKPIVAFEETATNDIYTVLLVAESRDPGTNDIWIEGDIAADEVPAGSWRSIPQTSKVPLKLSEPDGDKTVRVRLRNKFKNETELKTISIRKKSVPPTNCRAEVRGTSSSSRTLALRLSGDNQGKLYYRVYGDVEASQEFQAFEAPSVTDIILSKGAGEKKFTVQLRDEAENYCLKQEFKITYDPTYQAEGISVKDQALWSDAQVVTVQPRIDHFESDQVLMYIHGDIVQEEGTFAWIPYAPEIQVRLAPINGHRWIRVQYKINGEETNFRFAPIYYQPFVIVQGTSSPYQVVASDIFGLESLSIIGCQESYGAQSFQAAYPCTPAAPQVQITYLLKDGTSIVRQSPFPQ